MMTGCQDPTGDYNFNNNAWSPTPEAAGGRTCTCTKAGGSGKRLGGETAGESSDPLQARARRQLEGAGTWIRVLCRAAKWTNVGVPAESV